MNRLINILLVLVSMAASFGFAEWLVRRLPAAERLGWNLVPSVADRVENRQSGQILVLGDSFAEWMEQSGGNFARIAEATLHGQGHGSKVINLGEAGTGIAEYYRNLVTYGPGLKPGQVVVALYLGNDLYPVPDGLPSPDMVPLRLPPPVIDRDERIKRLLKRSVLLNLLFRQAKVHIPWMQSGFTRMVVDYVRSSAGKDEAFVTARLAQVDPELVREAEADAINGWDLATALFYPDYYDELAQADPGTRIGSAVRNSLADITVLCTYARELGADVKVVLIPPSPWVHTRYHGYFLRLGYGKLGPVDAEPPAIRLLKDEFAKTAIPVLDLLPILRASDQPVYLERDIHFNALGQQLAGQALAQFLLPGRLRRE